MAVSKAGTSGKGTFQDTSGARATLLRFNEVEVEFQPLAPHPTSNNKWRRIFNSKLRKFPRPIVHRTCRAASCIAAVHAQLNKPCVTPTKYVGNIPVVISLWYGSRNMVLWGMHIGNFVHAIAIAFRFILQTAFLFLSVKPSTSCVMASVFMH